ncbi:RNA 2',3'-cyclic phosphodiesterase [Candidatus Woesearchaeota archaeon]|nr:RNA 2',3'-cyclic phosphodiesterase [Candidatus Woesearchaeota archaeon]
MRCFIAIELPEKIKEDLRKINFHESIAKIIVPNDYHLTLKFLGDVSESKLERVKKDLSNVRFKPFKLKLDKIEFFPKIENFIRVVWIGIMPKRKIIKLKENIDDALIALFEREKRFEPHITLGRIKAVKDKNKLMEISNLQIDEGFRVDCFKLIKSELTEKGARYETLGEYS